MQNHIRFGSNSFKTDSTAALALRAAMKALKASEVSYFRQLPA